MLILAPNFSNPYYARILTGISDVATLSGYSALICNAGDQPRQQREALEMLKRRRADGAILMASNPGSDWLAEYAASYPLVQCSEYDPAMDVPRVSIDNYHAAQEVVEYLLGLGHTRIALISSENAYLSTRLRERGYCETLQKHGIPMRSAYMLSASPDYSFNSGKAKAYKLLESDPRPTAIFCISDVLALGAINAAAEMGIRVPQDLTVVGFDDVEQTTMFHPYLTTVAQPCYEIGRQAARLLHAQLSHSDDAQRQIVLEHQIIVRESSAPPNLRESPGQRTW